SPFSASPIERRRTRTTIRATNGQAAPVNTSAHPSGRGGGGCCCITTSTRGGTLPDWPCMVMAVDFNTLRLQKPRHAGVLNISMDAVDTKFEMLCALRLLLAFRNARSSTTTGGLSPLEQFLAAS